MTPLNVLWPLLLVAQVLPVPSKESNPPVEINMVNITSTTVQNCADGVKETPSSCHTYKLRICALEIAVGETDSALASFEDLQGDYEVLQAIIKLAAKNVKNVPKILKFIVELPQCNQRYAAFEFLHRSFDSYQHWNTQEAFQFAYQLKKFFDGTQNCSRVDFDAELKEKAIYLKHKIPEGIRDIIWQGSKLCVKNAYNDEFLYGADCCRYDGDRRRAFTWIPQGEIGILGEFTFEPIKDASLFRIKSDHFREHLYAAECCAYDGSRRNVFTWIPKGDIGTQGEWTLELVNGTKVFRIRNNHYDEYLYAAECCFYDKERRSIFTWIPKGDIGVQGEWEIAPC